jgi:uncharacterized membrane protein
MKTLSHILTALALTLPLAGAQAANWTITDLGALGAPGNAIYESRAYNINNAGQVAGQGVVLTNGALANHYVVWSNGTQIDLGIRITSSGVDAAPINDAGQVAGWIQAEDGQPFLWENGVVTRLPMLPNTVDGCRVTGINASGAVVGDNGVQRWWGVERVSVRWQGGVVADLGLPYGSVIAINDSGALAIAAGQMGQRSYVLSGGFTNLVNVPGLDTNYGTTAAADLNNAGQVCGWFHLNGTVDQTPHAFLWQGGAGTALPEVPGAYSIAVALNNHGHMVGSINPYSASHPAVLWRDGTLTILNDLPEVVAAGWSGLTARDINDHDQIVGYGYHGGLVKAFLLSPTAVPAPFALTIARSGTNVTVSFPTETGFGYQLQSSAALPAVTWQNEGAPIPGTGGVLVTNLPLIAGPGRVTAVFYRVQSQ